MQLQGTIKTIGSLVHVSDKFRKQEMVIVTEASTPYPQFISVEFQQDKTELLANYKEGDEVKIECNLRGRQWTNPQGEVKTFNTISVWRMENITANEGSDAGTTFKHANTQDNSDLPF